MEKKARSWFSQETHWACPSQMCSFLHPWRKPDGIDRDHAHLSELRKAGLSEVQRRRTMLSTTTTAPSHSCSTLTQDHQNMHVGCCNRAASNTLWPLAVPRDKGVGRGSPRLWKESETRKIIVWKQKPIHARQRRDEPQCIGCRDSLKEASDQEGKNASYVLPFMPLQCKHNSDCFLTHSMQFMQIQAVLASLRAKCPPMPDLARPFCFPFQIHCFHCEYLRPFVASVALVWKWNNN